MTFRFSAAAFILPLIFISDVSALSFGVFDARSLAMGGTGVSAGGSENASFYNPALLSIYSVRKEAGLNSRFVFPTITARIPNVVKEFEGTQRQAFDQDIIAAIQAFNAVAQPTLADAQAVLDASATFQSNLSSFNDGPVDAEANAGIVIGIGHLQQGGAMYFSSRAVAGSDLNGVDADKQLLNDYIEAMQFQVSGGTEGSAHPELFDNQGNLIDQTGSLSSEVLGLGVVIKELGISLSNQYRVFGSTYSIGITPKLMRVTTYDAVANGVNRNSSSSRQEDDYWKWNLDIGMLKEYRQAWWSGRIRSGLVLKNIFSRTYITALGNQFNMRPQLRAATSFHSQGSVYAIDLDVVANKSVGRGSESQILALGGEWTYRFSKPTVKYRAGINYNIKAQGKYKTPLYSVGARIDFGTIIDFTYAINDAEKAAGLQIAFRF